MQFYYHPVSSNCQKVLMAFYERGVPFEPVVVDMFDAAENARYKATVNPIGKIPSLMTDEGTVLPESSLIIEYTDLRHPGGAPPMIPEDRWEALEARRWDRFIDLYLNLPFSKALQDKIRPEGKSDPFGVEEAMARLREAYAILDNHLEDREWLAGERLTIADCAAAPSLHIGQRALPHDGFPNIQAYYDRLCGRPTWQRIWNENLPWREKIAGNLKAMRAAQGWEESENA